MKKRIFPNALMKNFLKEKYVDFCVDRRVWENSIVAAKTTTEIFLFKYFEYLRKSYISSLKNIDENCSRR